MVGEESGDWGGGGGRGGECQDVDVDVTLKKLCTVAVQVYKICGKISEPFAEDD